MLHETSGIFVFANGFNSDDETYCMKESCVMHHTSSGFYTVTYVVSCNVCRRAFDHMELCFVL